MRRGGTGGAANGQESGVPTSEDPLSVRPSAQRVARIGRSVRAPHGALATLALALSLSLLLQSGPNLAAPDLSPTAVAARGWNAPSGPTPTSIGPALLAAPETGGALTITSFLASPSTALKSTPVYLNVTVSGGDPPLGYAYFGLPPGCASHNLSSLLCYPISVENYIVTVVVNDSSGASVNASTPLTVESGYGVAPIINSFLATPATVEVDHETLISVNASSGSSTPSPLLAILFLDLPVGCASFNQSQLECIPSVAGSYQIWTRVTDGFGDFSQKSAFLNVTGAPSGSTKELAGSTESFVIIGVSVAGLLLGVAIVVGFRRRQRGARPPTAWHAPPAGPPDHSL
jgi:hypothetical protein